MAYFRGNMNKYMSYGGSFKINVNNYGKHGKYHKAFFAVFYEDQGIIYRKTFSLTCNCRDCKHCYNNGY